MNDDLISRSALLDIVGKMPLTYEYGQAVSDIYDIIKNAPTVYIEPTRNWVRVDDDLPKFEGMVQIVLHGVSIGVAWYDTSRYFELPDGTIYPVDCKAVTHWAPLPELPNYTRDN